MRDLIPKDHRGLMMGRTIFTDRQSKLIKEEEEEIKEFGSMADGS